MTSSAVDISHIVKVFEASGSSGACRTGLLECSLRFPPKTCYELRSNIQGDIELFFNGFFFNGKGRNIHIFYFTYGEEMRSSFPKQRECEETLRFK